MLLTHKKELLIGYKSYEAVVTPTVGGSGPDKKAGGIVSQLSQ